MVTLTTVELIRIVISIISALCAVYLVKKFVETRQKLTLLLILFFGTFSAFFVILNMVYAGVLLVNPILTQISFYAVSFGILLLILLAIVELRELYFLPGFLMVILIYQDYIFNLNRTYILNFFQYVSLSSTGNYIGNILFIVLKKLNPGLVAEIPIDTNVLNLLYDPLAFVIPDIIIEIALIYLGVIGTITVIFFYYVAWKNKSGRSLGFALGLTVILLGRLLNLPDITFNILIVIGTIFFAIGVFGVFDKLIGKSKKSGVSQKIKQK